MYFFTTQRHTQLVCHPSDDKKMLILSMLKRFARALGRLEQPLRNHAAQRTGFRAGTFRIRLREVEFGVGALTPGFDDLPGEIAGNE